jgi:OmpA-OmpF porin, OOP family
MRKFPHLALLAAGLIAAVPTIASAEDGFFIDGRVGRSSVDEGDIDDSDTAYSLNLGYRWGWFGVEAGYADQGSFSDTAHSGALSVPVKGEVDGFTLGVNGKFNFAEKWYLSGRVGAYFWDGRADNAFVLINQPNPAASVLVADRIKDSGTDLYAGIGVGYDLNDKVSIGLNYDHYDVSSDGVKLKPDVLSAGLEVRF